ncbi:hypothetical protein, partial [Caballeronia grimmiae]
MAMPMAMPHRFWHHACRTARLRDGAGVAALLLSACRRIATTGKFIIRLIPAEHAFHSVVTDQLALPNERVLTPAVAWMERFRWLSDQTGL